MSAAAALRIARENSIHIAVAGADLILDSEREPAPRVLETIRRHKASIVALLTEEEGNWTAEDWRAFYEERAGIAEFDGGQTRAEAEARAFEHCVGEWLNQHPEPSDPGHCAWFGAAETSGARVVPYGTSPAGHAWVHPGCWDAWYQARHRKVASALKGAGI